MNENNHNLINASAIKTDDKHNSYDCSPDTNSPLFTKWKLDDQIRILKMELDNINKIKSISEPHGLIFIPEKLLNEPIYMNSVSTEKSGIIPTFSEAAETSQIFRYSENINNHGSNKSFKQLHQMTNLDYFENTSRKYIPNSFMSSFKQNFKRKTNDRLLSIKRSIRDKTLKFPLRSYSYTSSLDRSRFTKCSTLYNRKKSKSLEILNSNYLKSCVNSNLYKFSSTYRKAQSTSDLSFNTNLSSSTDNYVPNYEKSNSGKFDSTSNVPKKSKLKDSNSKYIDEINYDESSNKC